MPNSYYDAGEIARQTLARSAALNAQLAAIEGGFDLLPDPNALAAGTVGFAVSTGAANAYVMTIDPAPLSITDGLTVHMQVHAANTGASTLNLNGLGVRQIRDFNGDAIGAGMLPLNAIVTLRASAGVWRISATPQILGDQSVTNAKLALMAASSFKLNNAGVPGAAIDGTVAQARALLGAQASTTDVTAAALLILGAFGLGASAITSDDWDAITATGIYQNTSLSTVGPPASLSAGSWLMLHVNGRAAEAAQFAWRTTAETIWTRRKTGSVWQPWVQVWHSGNLVKQASATDATAGSMLSVGAFGLGGTAITNAAWNAITTTGFYKPNDAADVGLPAGFSIMGMLHVEISSASAVQIAARASTGSAGSAQFWMRRRTAAATWTSWAPIYTAENLLGTVSQSGGVPTGSIIEQGSNANGRYVRFADGTQICWHTATFAAAAIGTAMLGGFRSAGSTWTFPAAFSAAVEAAFVNPTAVTVGVSGLASTLAAGSLTWVVTAVTSQVAADRTVNLMAIGRWF